MAEIPFCCRNGHIPLFAETTLPGRGRLARASALSLDVGCILNRIFLFVKSDSEIECYLAPGPRAAHAAARLSRPSSHPANGSKTRSPLNRAALRPREIHSSRRA